MLMYVIVHCMALCPRVYFTCMMSLVLWYSIVPFQCRNVWKCIWRILGFCCVSATRFLRFRYLVSMLLRLLANKSSLLRGSLLSMFRSLSLIGRVLGLLPFAWNDVNRFALCVYVLTCNP
jgi:hypothetical protein